MPTSVYGYIPHYLFFPQKSLFSLPPKVFGCVCFVQDTHPNLDKLFPRSIRCMFVGYSHIQKGYRCYDPVHRKYYVFADVTFFETVPFSSSMCDSSLSLPLTVPAADHVPQTTTDTPAAKPIKVYIRWPRQSSSFFYPAPPSIVISTTLAPSELDIPIALQKGMHSTAHSLSNFLIYDKLHPMCRTFALSLSFVSIPMNYQEASQIHEWRAVMDEEMSAIQSRETWNLIVPPDDVEIVSCRWVFTIKFKPNGIVDRYKARLVARGFT